MKADGDSDAWWEQGRRQFEAAYAPEHGVYEQLTDEAREAPTQPVKSEIETLFAQTLLGDYEDDAAWAAVVALRQNGSREIFERAAAWCLSDDPLKRARAADILCQRRRAPGTAEKPAPRFSGEVFRDESYLLIRKMLEDERDVLVINSAIHALGHLYDPEAVPVILRYRDHPDGRVRFAVAFALGCFPNDPQSVHGLMKLASDVDAEIRDWAVFGLAFADADSPEIRKLLLRCLDDSDTDVREEAAVGLGRRGDPRVVPKLLSMLAVDEPAVKVRVAEATVALLRLDKDPPEWEAAGYRAALIEKFQTSD